MSAKQKNYGFTVVEVMIFMAVSGLILASASGLFIGRQRQIQYEQGVRDLDFRIAETINNVVMGQFPGSEIACSNIDSGGIDYLQLNDSGGSQGTNEDCVFAGMALELDSSDAERIITTPIVAANPELGMTFPLTSENAKITAVIDLASSYVTSHGLIILDMVDDSGSPIDVALFLSSLGSGQDSAPSLLASGTQSINLFTANNQLIADERVVIDRVASGDALHICAENPNNSNIRASISLGFNRSELTTTVNQDVPGGHPCELI